IGVIGATHRFPAKIFSVVIVFIFTFLSHGINTSLGRSEMSTFLGELGLLTPQTRAHLRHCLLFKAMPQVGRCGLLC
ncbi:MAG: hypothetical protein ACN2B6_12390, partial [Rickettsiales bacterium]